MLDIYLHRVPLLFISHSQKSGNKSLQCYKVCPFNENAPAGSLIEVYAKIEPMGKPDNFIRF
jgi:hypothetical protein